MNKPLFISGVSRRLCGNFFREKLSKDRLEKVLLVEDLINNKVWMSRMKAQNARFPDGKELMKGVFHGK